MDNRDTKEDNSANIHRRKAIKGLASVGAQLSAIVLPLALTSLAAPARAQVVTNAPVIAALRFAQRLEYLMGAYYRRGLGASALSIPAAQRSQLSNMEANVTAHANFLSNVLITDAVTKRADTTYNVTGQGAFGNVLNDYQLYLTVAQVLEDTAVRAYKGLLLSLTAHREYMTAALNIHSVRARHAAAVRYLRFSANGQTAVKPWITGATGNDTGLAAADAFYQGEANASQAGVNITGAATTAAEAFDEPLTIAEAEALLAKFNL